MVGGHAVSLHARPRSTKDLDLWLDAAPDNIERACAALQGFGIPLDIVSELRAARTDEIVWMGRVPARIDFLQSISGIEFETAWSRRVTASFEGVPIYFIGRDDLIANKRATGRPQDLRDVRALERASDAGGQKSRGARRKTATKPTTKR
ncbi:DUF6036 family nucleotidyltransferase [Sorangium sp. So ce1078]|uniref:DUF6036 family nucleotidyltransferase n=1 Tax=Sorangium sp. So ce1078 TaxID=3133329 RepID=UPI003F62E3E8